MRQATIPRHLMPEWVADNPMRAAEEIERLRKFERAWIAIEEVFAVYQNQSIAVKAQKAIHEGQKFVRRVIG